MRDEIKEVTEKYNMANYTEEEVKLQFGDRPCLSDLGSDHELEEDPKENHSCPMTPKAQEEYEENVYDREYEKFFIQINNVGTHGVKVLPPEIRVPKPSKKVSNQTSKLDRLAQMMKVYGSSSGFRSK